MKQQEILSKVKATVKQEIPDALVYLFGSRVTGKIHDESDWDILVLTKQKYPKSVKRILFEKLFPLSISIGATIQIIMATEDEWENYPGYYSLQLGIGDQLINL